MSGKGNMANRMATREMDVQRHGNSADNQQSRRMLLALILLLVAVGVTVLRDRDYLFGNASEQESTVFQASIASAPALPAAVPLRTQAPPAPQQVATPTQTAPAPAAVPAKHVAPAAQAPTASHAAPSPAAAPKSHPVRTYKAEVIHQAPPAGIVSNAGQRTELSTNVPAPQPAHNYPLLDSSTRVQGSVVLQALISADGTIHDLRVLSGPAILGSAAREAVSQWHFKPYLENGRAVETQATITVNFTIKVADGNQKTARSYTPDKVIILDDNS